MDTQTKTIDTWRAWLVADSAFSFALRAHFGADAAKQDAEAANKAAQPPVKP